MKKQLLFLMAVLFLLSACSEFKVTPIYKTPDFNPENMRAASINICSSEKVELKNFIKSYNNAFNSNLEFTDMVTDSFCVVLTRILPEASISSSNPIGIDELFNLNQISEEYLVKVNEFFTNMDSDYLIYLHDYIIDEKITQTSHTFSGAGNMPMTSTTNSSSCLFSFTVDVWDARTKTKLKSYKISDSEGVFLFAYESALTSIIKRLSKEAPKYIFTDQIKSY